ncbi:uncharacterized protein ACR2FA_004174 [Aphomia sociella]
MTLRTPRRRISPRTKRRYRAIKDFLRRTLGNSSEQNIKINSSIAVNVTDLNHKISGLEQQLNNISKHLISVENSSQRESRISIPEIRDNIETINEPTEASSERRSKRIETKVLYEDLRYKTSEPEYKKSNNSDDNNRNVAASELLIDDDEINISKLSNNKKKLTNKLNVKNECHPNMQKRKTRSVYDKIAYSTSSYHSLIDPRVDRYLHTEHQNRPCTKKQGRQRDVPDPTDYEFPKKYKEQIKRIKPGKVLINYDDTRHERRKRDKKVKREVDQNFIADIIKKQYKPIRMFGKRESDISQFSAPVCRDQEFPIRENILEGSELCSCCYDRHRKVKYVHENDVSDIRSICDTRLYSSKRSARHKIHRRYATNYNDSALYDLVPVKEKSSPKSRRKFVENNTTPYQCYKEVPPSPRTLRPRLNLKAQHFMEFDEEVAHNKRKSRRNSPNRAKRRLDYGDTLDSNESSEEINNEKYLQKLNQSKKIEIQQDLETMRTLQTPTSNNEPAIVHDNVLNKTQETDSSADKTDKALCEIKDILQKFLQEIKKETNSQCDNSEASNKTEDLRLSDYQNRSKTNTVKNSQIDINNFSMSPCSLTPAMPYVPAFSKPCCYPILPVCRMNCMQSGYIVPSPSYTCANCVHNKDEVQQNNENTANDTFNTTTNNETDQLIKEIYNLVIQSPKIGRKNECRETSVNCKEDNTTAIILTSRSVGSSSKHDVKVGTPKTKCCSKSCEAIGSPHSDTYSRTNPSYSDTILEKLSLEATATEIVSETELSSDPITIKKVKENKFAKVLRSFRFFKKKKKNDVIEELSESESTTEVDLNKIPPFRQDITNYMMHDQEYFQQPPVPPTNPLYQNSYSPQHGYDYPHYCGPSYSGYPDRPQSPYNIYSPSRFQHESAPTQRRHSPQRPTAPPYPNPYNNYNRMEPQVPLCLKEIEVKSIATQSDRKISFFRKFTKKTQPPAAASRSAEYPQKNCSTQTAQDKKPGLFNWKNLQAKPTVPSNNDPLKFSYKTQRQLAEGDVKMRNAMLKKLFHKRNPFSPRNLIVRTLLGKDKSSFGEPPMMYRPRMFF